MTETVVDPRAATVTVRRTVESDVTQFGDARLVEGVERRSHAALAEIYARHGDEMHRLAHRLRGPALAGDVVQDVFLRLWVRPGLFDPERGSLRGFLMMQTRAHSIDLLRSDIARRAREAPGIADLDALSPSVDDGALHRLAGDHAVRLISRLSATERAAIVLAYFGDHTYREVALLLGQPEGTVKSRIRSGLGRLRHLMSTTRPESSAPPLPT